MQSKGFFLAQRTPNNAYSGLGGGSCKIEESKRKPFSVSLVGFPTKPLTLTVGRLEMSTNAND